MSNGRFDYVKYDQKSQDQQAAFKAKFQELEAMVTELGAGRAQSIILTKLEEAYMWVGKAVRDRQIADPLRPADPAEERGKG